MTRFDRFCLWLGILFMALCAMRNLTGCAAADRAAKAWNEPQSATTVQAQQDAEIAQAIKNTSTMFPYGQEIGAGLSLAALIYLRFIRAKSDENHAATQAQIAATSGVQPAKS